MVRRTRFGRWEVKCPKCSRPRIVREARFTVIECVCGLTYRAEVNGETAPLREREERC